jgi:outer membrane protein assembly factor BamA
MLRGFRTKGLGPRAGRSPSGAKGGDAFFTLSAAMTADPPSQALQAFGVKWHMFANAGNNIAAGDKGEAFAKMASMFARLVSTQQLHIICSYAYEAQFFCCV